MGGAVLALCLPKPGLSFLGWIAPAVLLWLIGEARTARRAALAGGLFGFAYCGVSLHWIYLTCRFAGVPVPVGVLALSALSALLAASWAAFGAGAWLLKRLPRGSWPWVWALLWAAIESAGARWTPRVGVDLLAYTQWRYLPMIQAGSVLGPHGLGLVLMLWAGALAEAVRLKDRVRFLNLGAAAALALSCGLYGAAVLSGRSPAPGGRLVEIIQPNIDQYRKWDARYEDDIRASFDKLMVLPQEERPALILWPESSLPGWLDEPDNSRWLEGWARRRGAPLLAGAVTRGGARHQNSAVLVSPEGRVTGVYHKRELVPFGEFVPLRRWLQGWIGILAQMGDFAPGRAEQPLLDTPLGKVAVTICYEAVFPRWGALDARRGARVFANLTNDGWYKDTWGPYQHLYTNMFRAVENRVTVLRAANTGVSGAFDPYGVALELSPIETARRLDLRLPAADPFPEGSFYARHGDWLGGAALFASAVLLAAALRRPGKIS